jgi:hypothetical protein
MIPAILLSIVAAALPLAALAGTAAKPKPNIVIYNLADDIGETNNLFSAKPEVVAKLTRLMKKVVEDGRSTPGVAQANDQPLKWKIYFEAGRRNPPRRAARKQAGGNHR